MNPARPSPHPDRSLWVVIPFFNEEAGIRPTLEALAAQTDPGFEVVLVDNASTDATVGVIEAFQREHPTLALQVVAEPIKGTGAAADTGFRTAIAAGATHIARTDADCLPRPDWIEQIHAAFDRGTECVAGRLVSRVDEEPLPPLTRWWIDLVTGAIERIAPLLAHNRGPEYLAPFVIGPGGNVAMTAELYERAGGFPRIPIEHDNDDRLLINEIRKLTPNIRKERDVVTAQSLRRVRAFGIKNTILWYWDRKYLPDDVDIR